MKQKKMMKYISMTLFLFMCLFSVNDHVNAAEKFYTKQCKYTFKAEYYTGGPFGPQLRTEDHQLLLNLSATIGGGDIYDYVSKSDIIPRTGAVFAIPSVGADQCPNITVYQRRSAAGNPINKFYIIPENGIGDHDQASDIVNGCSGKNPNDEYKGYRCGNLITPVSGTLNNDELKKFQNCPASKIREIQDEIKKNFNATVKSAFDSEYKNLNDRAKSFTGQTTKLMCDDYNYNNANFTEVYKNFLNNRNSILNQLLCSISPADQEELKNNYSSSGNRNITYESQRNSYVNSLYSTFTTNSALCYKNATDMNEDQKEEAKEEAKDQATQEKEEQQENLNKIHDQSNKYIDKIISIKLGDSVDLSCEGLLGTGLLDLLDEIFGYIQIAAPILLLILGSVDFGIAVFSDDKDALKKAGSKFLKRAVVCVAIFFAPIVISYLLHFIEGITTDPTCGIK